MSCTHVHKHSRVHVHLHACELVNVVYVWKTEMLYVQCAVHTCMHACIHYMVCKVSGVSTHCTCM